MRSVYVVLISSLSITMYSTSSVLMLGEGDGGKLSLMSSSWIASFNVCPGFIVTFNQAILFLVLFMSDDIISLRLVLCRFCRSWWIYPWTVATAVSKCLDIIPGVNPGQDVKWWFFIVLSSVDLTGKKYAAWRYCANSVCFFSCEWWLIKKVYPLQCWPDNIV